MCGVIGHVDKMCEKKKEGETNLQYDRSLRYIPKRRKGSVEMGNGGSGGRRPPSWTSLGSGGRSRFLDSSRDRWGKKGSDGPSWKKQALVESKADATGVGEEEEVQAP